MKRAKENKNSIKVIASVIAVIAIAAIAFGIVRICKASKTGSSHVNTNNFLGGDFLEGNEWKNSVLSNQIETKNQIENNVIQNTVQSNTIKNEVATNTTKPVSTGTTSNNANNNSSSNNSNKTESQTPTYKNSGTGGLPVLMYHFFYNASAGETARDNNFIEISAFESQMKYLSDNNFYFPTWQEVEDYIDGKKSLPAKSIVITVDDGDESFFRLALPVIEKYNVKATEFLVTSWNGWYCNDYKSSKVSYQSHSDQMHKGGVNGKGVLLSWSYDQIYKDLTDSKNCLNGQATVFCYPFGQYNENSKKILKDAGYKLAFTTQGGRVYKGADKYALPRVRISKGISLQSFTNMVN